ncbi:MAG: potassium channel family protein [Thermodesulfobacteriota bacterium]
MSNHITFRLRFFLAAVLLVMALGTGTMMLVEDLSLVDSFYYTVVTIATVGYGDVTPFTPAGKMLAVLLILLGTGTFLGVVANATEIMLNRRERLAHERKLHLLIGVYFSEVGTRLLDLCALADPHHDQFCAELSISMGWSDQQFQQAAKKIRECTFQVELDRIDMPALRDFLAAQRRSLVDLLENPITLEHENFTEHLLAVFHLNEELAARQDFTNLPKPDHRHLTGDVNRAYGSLVGQWVSYIFYLKQSYPYLYSLAVRTNPFNPKATVTLHE